MRIAYITDQVLPRSATDTRQLVSMASAMGTAGSEVTLVVPRRWFQRPPDRDRIAAYYEVLPDFSVVSVRSIYPNIRGIEKLAHGLAGATCAAAKRADVVYTRNLPVLIVSLLAGRPTVYETYRPWPDRHPSTARFFGWVGRHPSFLGAVLHSNLARDSYLAVGVPADRLLTAYNAFDADRLAPVLTKGQARTACGLPVDRKTVVYTGRLSRAKGLELLVDYAERLEDVTFVLVGSEGEGEIERRAAGLQNVRIVPWLPESKIAPFLHAADVLVIPPTSAPLLKVGNTVLPMKTFQYMAAGRAIFGPDTPDLRELLDDGETACLVPPDDPPEALRRLGELLQNSVLLDELGRKAVEKVSDMTWGRRADRVLGFIDERISAATRNPDGTSRSPVPSP